MHPPLTYCLKLSSWVRKKMNWVRTTFTAYKSTKEVHLAGSGEHSNAKLNHTETISPFVLSDLTLLFSF